MPAPWSSARCSGTRSSACSRSGSWTTIRRSSASSIHGVRRRGADSTASRMPSRGSMPDEVVIAMPTASGAVVRAVARQLPAAPACRSRTMPGVFELLDGSVSVNRLRNVDITDLLRRSRSPRDARRRIYLAGQRRCSSPGAGGSIGSELCRQVAHAQPAHARPARSRREQHLRRRQRSCASFPAVPVEPVIADIRDAARAASGVRRRAADDRLPRRRAQARAADGGRTPRRRSPTTSSARATSSTRRDRRRRRALRPDLDRQGGRARPASWARSSAWPR